MSKIGDAWYFIERGTRFSSSKVATAQIIGETPRKWILRETEEIEREATTYKNHPAPPGDGWRDWTIPKKGEDEREGRQCSRHAGTTTFYASEVLAQRAIALRQAQMWAYRHVYHISQQVSRITDPVLLKKVADLIGYNSKEAP